VERPVREGTANATAQSRKTGEVLTGSQMPRIGGLIADFEHNTVRARDPLPGGRVTIKLEYTSKGLKPGGTLNNGATVKLFVNGALSGEGAVGSGMIRQGIEPFEIGRDSISPVSPDYKSKGAFPFSGTIEKIKFDATPQRQ
jgi:hypothetical protein